MKKLLLALLALSSVSFIVPPTPVEACGINAGDYSLGMCVDRKVYTIEVKVWNGTDGTIYVATANGDKYMTKIAEGHTKYLTVHFDKNGYIVDKRRNVKGIIYEFGSTRRTINRIPSDVNKHKNLKLWIIDNGVRIKSAWSNY